MNTQRFLIAVVVTVGFALALSAQQAPPSGGQQPPASPAPQQPTEIRTVISAGDPALPPKLAVPPFIALTNDPETQAAAKTIGEVLWDDIAFEKEFYMIPRDTYRSIPQPTSIDDIPVDRWKELGADGVLVGSIRKTGSGVAVQMRLINVASGTTAMAKEYTGAARTIQVNESRLYSHTIADELHKEQRGLNGIARTKLAFSSDRDGERLRGPVGDRGISNLYISDYDGARQQRVTISKALDISPVWSPDGKTIAFSSWRTGYQDIYYLFPYGGSPIQNPTKGTAEKQNYLPAWSPDGAKVAFTSSRDGNAEIYVMNRDGSGVQRLTNHPSIDVTPTWSPAGTQIAFTSERSGNPQIYIMNADGTGLQRITNESQADRPTWSPAPLNEIAFSSRSGAGNIIKVFDFATRNTRALTDAIGNNESPAFSPNGRHVAFVSSRAGKEQIFLIHRDGSGLTQITRAGNNRFPHWSR
jgi:TolB protein